MAGEKPTMKAFVVEGEGDDAFWVRCGSAWPHKDGREDNDPHGEHDFGSFELQGEKLFWKIDYYDLNAEFGSEDPADPKKTLRVMTIMLAEEY